MKLPILPPRVIVKINEITFIKSLTHEDAQVMTAVKTGINTSTIVLVINKDDRDMNNELRMNVAVLGPFGQENDKQDFDKVTMR